MTSNQNISQYNEWCETLKIELKRKSKINVKQRISQMIDIVNCTISDRTFSISAINLNKMMQSINVEIDSWRGVEIGVCKNKEKKDFSAYQATANNWFNRNKAKIYGNHLFFQFIFHHILKYCVSLNNCTNKQKVVLFIDIFVHILAETVQFPRTKLQPLIPHQALMQTNAFKDACKQFTAYYDNQWIAVNYEKRDRDRAKKTNDSFVKCLERIKNYVQNMPNYNVPVLKYPFVKNTTLNPQGQNFQFDELDFKSKDESEVKLDAICTLTLMDQQSGSTLDTISDIMPIIEPPQRCSRFHHFDQEYAQRNIPHIQAPNMQNIIAPNSHNHSSFQGQYWPINEYPYGPIRGSAHYTSQRHRYSPIIPTVNTPNYTSYSPITPIFPTSQFDHHHEEDMQSIAMSSTLNEMENFDESFIDNNPFEFAANYDFSFNFHHSL